MRRLTLLPLVASLAACASIQRPAALTQAEAIQQRLQSTGGGQRVEAELLRTREAIQAAQNAYNTRKHQDYVNGMAHIALRTAQVAEAENDRMLAERAADSLRTARLNRLLTLSEAQRASLAQQQQLSAAEISALRERNMLVSQQADSLRRANEAANAALNGALTQLQSLVTEITNLKETTRGLVISLSDILFDVNKATLKPGAESNVRKIATILKQYPNHQISVEGHTDATGSDAYNQKLSEDRAASVRAALVAGGVDPASITSRGFGKSQPVAENRTAAGRQANRRVEVVVLGAGKLADAANVGATGATGPTGAAGMGAGTSGTTTPAAGTTGTGTTGTRTTGTTTTNVRDSMSVRTTITSDSSGTRMTKDSTMKRDSTSTPPR